MGEGGGQGGFTEERTPQLNRAKDRDHPALGHIHMCTHTNTSICTHTESTHGRHAGTQQTQMQVHLNLNHVFLHRHTLTHTKPRLCSQPPAGCFNSVNRGTATSPDL